VEQSGAFRIKIASKFFHLPNSLTFAFPKKQGDKYVSFSSLYTDPCQERNHARVAQLVEQLICNQQVAGSIPLSGSAAAGEAGGMKWNAIGASSQVANDNRL
jgi:hypothetical protein